MDKQTIQNENSKLQWHDYIIIGIVLLISASIGIYYRFTGGRQQTIEEYFSADRSMKILPLGIAMTVSFISAITILGISAEIYVHGTMFTVFTIGFLVGAPIAMYCYLPVFFELKVMSVFEYIEKRFGIKVRLLASIANFCHMTLHTGIVLYAPSIALEATTGLSSTLSIILIGIICTFYSTIGGIKAVLISDVFQGLLMLLSTLCIIGIGCNILPNGIYDVWDRAMRGDRINLNVNLRASQMALIVSAIIMFILIINTIFAGLVMYAVYMDCDPMKSGKISSTDKLMPYFVIDKLSYIPGFAGLFISGVFSASLSTISAMLNSLAALAIEDYIKPIYSKIGATFPKEKATFLGKLLAVLNGILCVSIALIAGKLGSLIEAAIGLIGIIGGPLLGIFTFGMFFESANEIGAIVGMIFTVIALGFIAYGPKVPITTLPMFIDGCENGTLLMLNETIGLNSTISNNSNVPYINRISYAWYPVIGMLLTIIVGYLTSLITNNCISNTREYDPNLFTPFIAARIKKRRQNEQRVTSSQMFVLEPTYRK
ncbi:putative sodium-dependent multivitamin transporter isoform X3 [Vespa velutina]|uniref:putative sodium-dependent multivitamin transporter isoform X3 n=1 Tax=Vespa velutina TaxID=202808 RepID=UPI001FB1FA13|nr:putative sodium-dependent multivitamin transporter isoform X3 [Vespa velutina]